MRALALLALSGCVSLAPNIDIPPECVDSIDCPMGESCRDGFCYGNPPQVSVSAQLLPPATRPDLAATEIESLTVSAEGSFEMSFAPSAEVSGRVVLPPLTSSVPARLRFSRASHIPGAPPLTVEVDATAGRGPGEVAFKVRLGLTTNDDLWLVTIVPDDTNVLPALNMTLAQAAPSRRVAIAVTGPTVIDLPLVDAAGLKELHGTVTDAAARGLEGLRVSAYGRPAPGAPLELCSSSGRTLADGSYTLRLPVSWEDTFDVVVEPTATVRSPILRQREVQIPDGANPTVLDLSFPSFPTPAPYDLPVYSKAPAGGNAFAVDADVVFTTTLLDEGPRTVTYRATGTVDARGLARVDLIPGTIDENRPYLVRVLPPLDEPHGSVWDVPVEVGAGSGGVLPDLILPRRALMTGRVVDHEGDPVKDLAVRPGLSPSFILPLPPALQVLLAGIRPVEVATNEDGRFEIYLDAELLGLPALYDLELVPPTGSLLPRWSVEAITIPTDLPAVDYGDLALPRGALADGPVKDTLGNHVGTAEVRIWAPSDQALACAPICVAPAHLRVLAASDLSGRVRLVLPSP